jgi:hypothetical protein
MPQTPFQVDQLQIEPSSGDTIIISRDSGDGSLVFADALITSGIKLSSLVGMVALPNVFVVGANLIGASHTTVQSALNDVPNTASDTDPYVIVVTSGVYQEDIAIEKSGVILLALGYVVLENATATNTITIRENTVVPTFAMLKGFHIKNSSASQSCVRIIGGANSTVGSDGISFLDCHFMASATGYPIRSSSVGKVYVKGGDMRLSNASAFCLVEETAIFSVVGVSDLTAMQLDYDSTGDLPSVPNSEYRILDCNFNSNSTVSNSIVSTISGGGSLFVSNVSDCGALSLDGNRTFTFFNCIVGNIVSSNSAIISLRDCKRGTVTGTGGSLAESKSFGTLTFLASASETYSFGIDQPDLNYMVMIENDRGTGDTEMAYVSAKALGSFDVSFNGVVSTAINFVILRDV